MFSRTHTIKWICIKLVRMAAYGKRGMNVEVRIKQKKKIKRGDLHEG